MNIHRYAVYTLDSEFSHCVGWAIQHGLAWEPHLNRTHIMIPNGPLLTEFLLRWGHSCDLIDTDSGNKVSS
jgi:hypothetical protein